jgi:hypothetical protein
MIVPALSGKMVDASPCVLSMRRLLSALELMVIGAHAQAAFNIRKPRPAHF